MPGTQLGHSAFPGLPTLANVRPSLPNQGAGCRVISRSAIDGDLQGLGGEAAKGKKQLVGVEQGESSGDDTCMIPNARVIIQNAVNPEPVGFRICTGRAGTGINAANPGPSRYGNAAPGRGNCLEKMKV